MSAVKCRCGSSLGEGHIIENAPCHNGQSVARCHIAEFPLQEQSQWQNSVGRVRGSEGVRGNYNIILNVP